MQLYKGLSFHWRWRMSMWAWIALRNRLRAAQLQHTVPCSGVFQRGIQSKGLDGNFRRIIWCTFSKMKSYLQGWKSLKPLLEYGVTYTSVMQWSSCETQIIFHNNLRWPMVAKLNRENWSQNQIAIARDEISLKALLLTGNLLQCLWLLSSPPSK